MIHEGITSISNKLSIHSLFPDAHGMWILVYPIILIVFLLIFWKGLLEFLNEKTGRSIFIIGSVVFVAGGVGLEVLGYYLPFKQGEETIINIIEVSTEESFEMLGQSLIIYALLSKIYPTQTNISKATKIF